MSVLRSKENKMVYNNTYLNIFNKKQLRDEKIINATSSRRYFFFTRAKFDANNGLFKENVVKYKGKRTSQDVVFIVFSYLRRQSFLKFLTPFRLTYIYLIFGFVLCSNLATAQCEDSGNYWNESWVSCEKTLPPSPVRVTDQHWIEYEFHQPQSIDSIRIWNANRTGESNMGAKLLHIDYTVDGINWIKNAVTLTLPKANEQDDYEGFQFATGFEDVFVKKILFVVFSNYGNSDCMSIAEAQFKINPDACYGIVDACGECDGSGATTWYLDADNDGLGHPDTSIQDCNQPAGYVANADDYCDNSLLGWREVGAIFSDNGCTGCHGNNALGGLNLTTYDNAVLGGNKCGPDILTGTTLTSIITTTAYAGCGMPIGIPSMNDRVGGQIDDTELALLQTWVDAGAPEDCNCLAGAPDADNDQTCDAIDDCPNFDNQLIGTPCDDGLICTENDVWTTACDCKGQLATDSDNDGVCDIEDSAPNDACTADGIIDGIEPDAWLALPTNDCDTDGVSNVNGDLNDFASCINNQGQIATAACNCPTNMALAGGRFTAQIGMNARSAAFADGLPDGRMSSYVGYLDSLFLSFPYMAVGEEICITLGFQKADGIANFSVNNSSFTYLNFAGLGDYQPQEFCFKTLNEGIQTVVITDIGGGGFYVDGSTYSYCPCSPNDPKHESPSCNCTYDSTSEDGIYDSSVGFANPQRADGAPDGSFTNYIGGTSDTLNLTFPNITAGGEICITLGFSYKTGLAKFDVDDESHYFPNAIQDSLYTAQEFCFVNKSGNPNVAVTEIGGGGIKVDGSRYYYCTDCPTNANGDTPIEAELHAWLEGSYDPPLREMTIALNERGLLPGQTPVSPLATPTPAGQPYQSTPWNHSGTEGTTWNDTNYTAIESDWVLVSFRTAPAKSTEVATTAALLNRDGSIRFPDRCALPSGDTPLYVVIEHRNHIGIMSPQAIGIQSNVLTYDFRRSDSYKDNTSFGQKKLPTGEWVMYAGDANQMDFPSFDINGTDKTEWFNNNGLFDYYLSPDFNLDGDVNGQDKSLWFDNNGISSRVPK